VVVFAGEPFPIDGVRTLAGWTDARLFNFYGPTETNVCTAHEVRPADLERDKPVPIGRASSGDRVWVETADGPSDAPGAEGELVAEGPTIMLGYQGRPSPGGTYRTGDLVRILPDGVLDYLGRRDAMVKVRGYRVELGEVEAALATHPDVADVAAVVVGSGPESRLAAFVVAAPGGRAPGPLAVRRHAARLLPAYMLPDLVRPLAALPRTANGKVDRRLLADLADRPADRPAGLSA
jgi:acyl-coenzyme A synthetase/AMP-(fatty) acid ligase